MMLTHAPGVSQEQYQQIIAFLDAACRVIPERYPVNSCIACTRIAIEVLSRYRFQVRPCSVEVLIANPPLAERMRRFGRPARTLDELGEWSREDGSWMVNLGGGELRAGYWAGHLVAVANGHVMIDLSLPQANAPDRAIHLTPLVCDVTREFVKGLVPHTHTLSDCRVEYRAFPHKIGYQTANDWANPASHRDAVETIQQMMAEQLAEQHTPVAV